MWPGTRVTARKGNVGHITKEGAKYEDVSESGNKSESTDEDKNSDTEGEQENNQVNWDHVWPGTREKARKRSIRHTTMEGGMNEAKDEGRSGKYEGEGRDKDEKNTAKPKKMVKENTVGVNKDEGAASTWTTPTSGRTTETARAGGGRY